MRRALLPAALGALLAASCLVPSMELVDSLGDSGEAGEGGSGASSGAGGSSSGVGPSAGGKSAGGSAGTPASGANGGGSAGRGGQGGTPGHGGSAGEAGDGSSGDAGLAGMGGDDSGGSSGSSSGGAGSANGGRSGEGGAAGGSSGSTSGGAGGSGGAGPVTCDASFSVGADGFVRTSGIGFGSSSCWHGYAFIGGDDNSIVMPNGFQACGEGCVLRMTGMVGPAIPENDYAGVAYLGINLQQERDYTMGTVSPRGTGVALQFTHTGTATLRAQFVVDGMHYCTELVDSMGSLDVNLPYALFSTACWEGGQGVSFDKQPLEAFQLVVIGGDSDQTFDVTLHSVREY